MPPSPTWGGARPGAGRPAQGPRPSEPHKRRPALSPRHPVHVTARFAPQLAIPRRRAYQVIQRALTVSLARSDFRIIHVSLQRGRLELLVEAQDRLALAKGMQGFQVSAAKGLNRAVRRRGNVFADRYRMRILRTRAAVRDALSHIADSTRAARTRAWPHTWLVRVELLHAKARDPTPS